MGGSGISYKVHNSESMDKDHHIFSRAKMCKGSIL